MSKKPYFQRPTDWMTRKSFDRKYDAMQDKNGRRFDRMLDRIRLLEKQVLVLQDEQIKHRWRIDSEE